MKYKVIRTLEIEPLSQEEILEVLKEHIQKQLPDAKVDECELVITSKGIELRCNASFNEPVNEVNTDKDMEPSKQDNSISQIHCNKKSADSSTSLDSLGSSNTCIERDSSGADYKLVEELFNTGSNKDRYA